MSLGVLGLEIVKIAAIYKQKEAVEACFDPWSTVVNICVTKINIFKNLFL